eukprot:1444548-Alexandrium_andersonii.AAC.1
MAPVVRGRSLLGGAPSQRWGGVSGGSRRHTQRCPGLGHSQGRGDAVGGRRVHRKCFAPVSRTLPGL